MQRKPEAELSLLVEALEQESTVEEMLPVESETPAEELLLVATETLEEEQLTEK